MKNEHLLWFVLGSIFLIVFNAAFFVVGGLDRNASVWISYGFLHFAYFMLLFIPRLIPVGENAAVYFVPPYSLSVIYFLAELFIGTIFILLSMESSKVPFLIQFFAAGVYAVMLIPLLIANKRTAEAEEERQYRISFVKESAAKIQGLLESINDKEVKKKVERVYDAIYSSPVKSYPDMADAENHILQSIRALEEAVAAENRDGIMTLAGSLETAINGRNQQLKIHQ
jgi:hypothetical protein